MTMFELTITRHRKGTETRSFATLQELHDELYAMGVPRQYWRQGYWALDERYDWREVIELTPVRTRTCGTCGGTTTIITVSGVPVVCQNCGGTGVTPVYTRAQRQVMERTYVRRQRSLDAIKACARSLASNPYDRFVDVVRSGFDQLEAREPHRLEKLYTSIDRGRTADVVRALYTYRQSLDA
jgi:ribosomal protein S27E